MIDAYGGFGSKPALRTWKAFSGPGDTGWRDMCDEDGGGFAGHLAKGGSVMI